MARFFVWVTALICQWLSLAGGSVVSVALLVYAQYGPEDQGRWSAMTWWIGIAVGFMIATFLTWKEEHVRANELATIRPEFSPKYTGLEQSQDTAGKPLPDQFLIRFWFHNGSNIPVKKFRRKVIVIKDFSEPPLDVTTSENANSVYTDINLRAMLTHIPPNAPAHYFVVLLSYQDSRNGHDYSQTFYYVWMGSGSQQFWMGFHDASIEELEQITAYLKARGIDG